MNKYYSPSTRGFYADEIHGDSIPANAVEITTEQYQALLAGQSSGKLIQADADGYPILVDPPPAPPAPPPNFTSLEYLDLFTEAEQLAVATAAMNNAAMKLWYDRMLAANFITLADERTEAGLDALVTAGLLTSARKSAIVGLML